MLRVLAYCDSFVHSGAEMYWVEVLRGLERQPDVHLVAAAPPTNARLRAALATLGIPAGRVLDSPGQVHRLAAFHLLDPRRNRRAATLLRSGDYDVVLMNLAGAEHGTRPLFTRPGRALPSVGLVHLHQTPTSFGVRLGPVRERLAKVGMRRLDTACSLSQPAAGFTRAHWLRPGAVAEVVPMPEPTVVRTPTQDARRTLGLGDAGVVVGYAGRLNVLQKGFDVFVEAAGEIARSRPDVRFAVAGEGEDQERGMLRVRELGLVDRFTMLGHVADIGMFLSAIDALMVTSRAEGLPLLALEALRLGVPGVVAGVDGLLEVWPPEWQVPPGDPVGMAAALLALLDEEPTEVWRLSDQGRALAEQRTAADLGPVFADVLRATLDRSRGG